MSGPASGLSGPFSAILGCDSSCGSSGRGGANMKVGRGRIKERKGELGYNTFEAESSELSASDVRRPTRRVDGGSSETYQPLTN